MFNNFSQYYSASFDYVYRYVFIRIANREITQDLVSKIFLDAFENQAKYDSTKGSWKQWITGIAKNCLLNHWRSNRKWLSLEEVELDQINFEKFDRDKDKLSEALQFQKIMESVPQKIKNLLIWRYVDDLTYEDIAEILDKTPAAVRKTFSRLHKTLKEKLGADLEA